MYSMIVALSVLNNMAAAALLVASSVESSLLRSRYVRLCRHIHKQAQPVDCFVNFVAPSLRAAAGGFSV